MVSLIQTTIATVLGPLVGQIDAQRQTIDRQAETIAELREERGCHAAELERAASTIVTLNAALEARTASESTPASVGASTPRLRVLVPWAMLVAILLLAVAVGWPPAWPG
jgi:hypothetical protein